MRSGRQLTETQEKAFARSEQAFWFLLGYSVVALCFCVGVIGIAIIAHGTWLLARFGWSLL